MADNVLHQLAALHETLQSIPIRSAGDRPAMEKLEAVKRGLDDARLGLWARLQGAHANDITAFEERFRIRRALELCSRITTDLRIGIMNPGHPEFADLWIATVELSQAIQEARAQLDQQGG